MKRKLNFKWSSGNEKLKKLKTVSFNLPAFESKDGFKVCPKAGACATVCYARQGRYMMKAVQNAREFNLARARKVDLGPNYQTNFVHKLIADLKRIKAPIIRIHDSGDFFSQAYLQAWLRVIKVFPEKKFYCYTKSLHLDWTYTSSNFQVVQSVGGLMDSSIDKSKSHSRIFASHSDRVKAGYVNGNINDGPAIRGENKIGLVYHGTKNLKEGQIAWLKAI